MEEKNNIPFSDTSVVNTKKHFKEKFLLIFASIIIIGLVSWGLYLFDNNTKTEISNTHTVVSTTIAMTTSIISTTEVLPPYKEVAIKADTISFAIIDKNIYLRYHEKYYKVQMDTYFLEEVQLVNSSQYKWYGLVDTTSGYHQIYDFQSNLSKDTFLIDVVDESNKSNVYLYSKYNSFNVKDISTQITNIATTNKSTGSTPSFGPISNNGKFVVFNLIRLASDAPRNGSYLLNLENYKNTKIEEALLETFNWSDDGKYTYKPAIEMTCPQEGTGKCYKDESVVTEKSGIFN